MRPYAFRGGTAVVTGAGSGIGEGLAYGLADRGSHLVLLDRHADRLDRVAGTARGRHPDLAVATLLVDLADPVATREAGARLAAEHPETTLLINNAGVALGGRFDQVSLEQFDRVLRVNLAAVVTLTHALLPVLQGNPGSHLATVSSVFGLLAPPGQAAYASSKFAVRGFTEVLRAELAGRVGVTVVHPGGVATRIAADATIGSGVDPTTAARGLREFETRLTIPSDRAAAAILRGVERRRPRVLIGWSAVLPDLLVRLLPGAYSRLIP